MRNVLSLKSTLRISVIWSAFLIPIPAVASQPNAADKAQQRPGSSFSFTGALVEQMDSDFDNGGSYSVSSILLRASVLKPVSRSTRVGFNFNYDFSDYNFTDPVAFGGISPWNKIHNLTFGVPVIARFKERWSILAIPSLSVIKESNASTSDALAYGAVFAFNYSFRADRRLGLGAGIFERVDEFRAFPFISVNWHFTDRLRLINPLRAGPTGPAGLELAYDLNSNWEFGAGAAYRSFRFRLNDQGIAPGGVGEQSGLLAFARFSRRFGPKYKLYFYAGAALNGDLRLEDRNNQRLVTAPHGTAPLLAVSFTGRI